MESLSRTEYPAILTSLQPAQAVSVFNERLKRIGSVNNEIADWLQERRRVEELYVQGLRKLAQKQPPNSQSELGVFTTPWQKIVAAIDSIAASHHTFATRIEKDVELPLREFGAKNREMKAMTTIQGNLGAMQKKLEEAQQASDKLLKKGGKASSVKVDSANLKLDTASQEWDSQTPYVFEKLQAVDETRLNHLRDVLTQFQTHEADQVERNRITAENTLNSLLEIETAVEILNFANNATQGKPKLERNTRRQGSSAGSSTLPPPPPPQADDNGSEYSGKNDGASESKGGLKRLGTILGRRRQSIHGPSYARAPSPSKTFPTFGRNNSSRDGRPTPSPRASSNNLRDSPSRDNRLSSLAESPPAMSATNGTFHGLGGSDLITEEAPTLIAPTTANGATSRELPDLSDVQPPAGPPPSHQKTNSASSTQRDSEGYNVPATHNDPISLAQWEASNENDQQQFKLDIRSEPIKEEDADAQAALSSVANTLRSSTLATPSRKAGTIRGRRDVRNTMYIPAPETSELKPQDNNSEYIPGNNIPPSPTTQISTGRAAALAALSSGEHSGSDAQSIRSARSLTNNPIAKHPEMHQPGMNSSIIETVSAHFENGVLKTVAVVGELAMVHVHDESHPFASSGTETIRINNFQALEAIAPNHAFVEEVSSDRPGEYKVNLSNLAKTAVAFRYKVHIDEANLTSHVPLILKPAWRPQGDKLGIVIEYGLNPSFAPGPITLNNLVLIATYDGAKAAGCQTKPTGTHLKEKSLIYWRLGDVTLDNNLQKVIARLVGAEGAEPQPGLIEARWEYHEVYRRSNDTLGISKLDTSGKGKEKEEVDPFADESLTSPSSTNLAGSWVEIPCLKKTVSGKYDAKQLI